LFYQNVIVPLFTRHLGPTEIYNGNQNFCVRYCCK